MGGNTEQMEDRLYGKSRSKGPLMPRHEHCALHLWVAGELMTRGMTAAHRRLNMHPQGRPGIRG